MSGSKTLPPSTERFYPTIFVRNQFRTHLKLPPSGTTNLTDHVAIVTGSNTGLGLELSRLLLSYNLTTLILAVRSPAKGEAAAASLRAQHPKATIHVWVLDMASYPSITAFADRVRDELPRLDMVILNAGLCNLHREIVPTTGHDETLQVNYLSTALLTLLLLPHLKAKSPVNKPGRLTIVSAALSLTAEFPASTSRPLLGMFDDDATSQKYDANGVYCTSKLFAHMFLWKLVEHVSPGDVIVNLADPGLVGGTELFRGVPAVGRPFLWLFVTVAARSLKMGASTLLDAVVSKGAETHGAFLMSYEVYPFHSKVYTPKGHEAIEMLWTETLDELAFADVRGILKSLRHR